MAPKPQKIGWWGLFFREICFIYGNSCNKMGYGEIHQIDFRPRVSLMEWLSLAEPSNFDFETYSGKAWDCKAKGIQYKTCKILHSTALVLWWMHVSFSGRFIVGTWKRYPPATYQAAMTRSEVKSTRKKLLREVCATICDTLNLLYPLHTHIYMYICMYVIYIYIYIYTYTYM